MGCFCSSSIQIKEIHDDKKKSFISYSETYSYAKESTSHQSDFKYYEGPLERNMNDDDESSVEATDYFFYHNYNN